MKKSFFKNKTILVCTSFWSALIVNPVSAANSWKFAIEPRLIFAQYNESQQRDTLFGYGALLNADYLDNSGFKFGYNSQTVNGKPGYPDIEETGLYASGNYIHYSDFLGGKTGLRLDGYSINDQTNVSSTSSGTGRGRNQTTTSSTSLTDKVKVVYAQLDYMTFASTYYADVGYGLSRYNYENNDLTDPTAFQDNKVSQLTATVGFAFNNRYDWLQSRGYFIHMDHGDNTAGVTRSSALEIKWLHWFKPGSFLHVHSSLINLVLGKRLYPVDPDTQTTYSISDLQTGSVAAGMDWAVGDQGKFLLLAGYDRYENLALANKYSSRYIFSSFSFKW